MIKLMMAIAAVLAASLITAPAYAEDKSTLADLAFLEGHWRGGDDFVFEEIWSGPEGGVITAMARGVSSGAVRVLEYIVVTEEETGLIMRFKHFNVDYSTWEKEGEIISLPLTAWGENDVTFSADPPSLTVKSIRYWMPSDTTLQADIVLVEDGEEGGFSLSFERVGE